MKKVLVVNGHNQKVGTNAELTKNYIQGLRQSGKAEIREVWLADLPLEKFLKNNHFEKHETDPVIKEQQDNLVWAEHIVYIHPVWWGSLPALFKVYIEMVFQSGFAFRYIDGKPEGLLPGKTAHIITTCDTPPWIYKYIFLAPSVNELKNRTLEFCGIKVNKVTYFGSVVMSKEGDKTKWYKQAYNLGKNLI